MTDPTPLTVIAATCNEAGQVDEWLDHLSWVQRVVIVDTGSRDGTIERLEARGVEVIRAPRSSGAVIHCAKNQALARVGRGWVLDLDLDERVPAPLRDEIHTLLSAPRDGAAAVTVAGYRIPFRHHVFGRWLEHGGWRTRHLRLYQAECARYPEDRAHSTLQLDGEVGELSSPVVHFAHPRIHDFLTKMNRYTSQDAELMLSAGKGGLRNRAPLPAWRLAYLRAALGVFWNRYVRAQGFRDRMPGFLVAVLLGAYAFVEQAKYWEASQAARDQPLPAGSSGNSPVDVDHPPPS